MGGYHVTAFTLMIVFIVEYLITGSVIANTIYSSKQIDYMEKNGIVYEDFKVD